MSRFETETHGLHRDAHWNSQFRFHNPAHNALGGGRDIYGDRYDEIPKLIDKRDNAPVRTNRTRGISRFDDDEPLGYDHRRYARVNFWNHHGIERDERLPGSGRPGPRDAGMSPAAAAARAQIGEAQEESRLVYGGYAHPPVGAFELGLDSHSFTHIRHEASRAVRKREKATAHTEGAVVNPFNGRLTNGRPAPDLPTVEGPNLRTDWHDHSGARLQSVSRATYGRHHPDIVYDRDNFDGGARIALLERDARRGPRPTGAVRSRLVEQERSKRQERWLRAGPGDHCCDQPTTYRSLMGARSAWAGDPAAADGPLPHTPSAFERSADTRWRREDGFVDVPVNNNVYLADHWRRKRGCAAYDGACDPSGRTALWPEAGRFNAAQHGASGSASLGTAGAIGADARVSSKVAGVCPYEVDIVNAREVAHKVTGPPTASKRGVTKAIAAKVTETTPALMAATAAASTAQQQKLAVMA